MTTQDRPVRAPGTASGSGIGHMIVGLDGSSGSNAALAWALRHTDLFGPVKPVSTWLLPWWASGVGSPGVYAPPPTVELQLQAENDVERQLERVDRSHILDPVVVHGRAGKTLVELSADANLLVVGTRGRGALADTLLGSVSSHVSAHAACPVAIIPDGSRTSREFARIVVGIDGSASSRAALDWAIRHSSDDSVIEVVHAWSPMPPGSFEVPVDFTDELRVGAEGLTAKVVEEAAAAHNVPLDRFLPKTIMGDPRNVLNDEAADADLVVVGARGHRGVAYLLLGSVASAIVHQPHCPIIVVPAVEND